MFKNIVVCAANKVNIYKDKVLIDTIVVADSCHFGRNMQAVFNLLRSEGYTIKPEESAEDRGQGFIDESGLFLTRKEAYEVAKNSGQPFNDEYTLPDNRLDSSCIRHFREGDKNEADTLNRNKGNIS